jgi:hypothetical protein
MRPGGGSTRSFWPEIPDPWAVGSGCSRIMRNDPGESEVVLDCSACGVRRSAWAIARILRRLWLVDAAASRLAGWIKALSI